MNLNFSYSYTIDKIKDVSFIKKGLYVWLLKKKSIEKLPIPYPDHQLITINNKQYYLLYIGIGPEKESSSSTLLSRLLNDHINGNIYGSTFRYSMSALLGLQFFYKSKIKKKASQKNLII